MTRKTDDPVQDENPAPADGDGDDSVSGDAVADYLRRNPDFFAERLELLSEMAAPSRWTGDGIVDMQKYLAETRLGEIDALRNCAQEVIETSRSNMSVQTRTHAAVLAMLSGVDVDHLLRVINDDLPLLLDVDVVVLGFEPTVTFTSSRDIHQFPKGGVDDLLGVDENIHLMRESETGGPLFGAASGLVRSAVLARLRPNRNIPAGIVALGSRGSVFCPGQGTELIGFLARVLEQRLHRLAEQSD